MAQVCLSVDLFDESADVPAVDTLLLRRPTDSPTPFLQQLGRGLRRAVGKTVCTVLDFVGRHRSEFRFDRRFRALLGGSRQDVAQQVRSGFPLLPAGCQMKLDRVARDIVLQTFRDAVPSRWTRPPSRMTGHAPPESMRSSTVWAMAGSVAARGAPAIARCDGFGGVTVRCRPMRRDHGLLVLRRGVLLRGYPRVTQMRTRAYRRLRNPVKLLWGLVDRGGLEPPTS